MAAQIHAAGPPKVLADGGILTARVVMRTSTLIPAPPPSRTCAACRAVKVSARTSELSQSSWVATPGEFAPLRLGNLKIDPPLLVAPMAGITNAAFREMYYEAGAPLCVSEMVTAGTLLQQHRYALKICEFGDVEPFRSAQLYGVKPEQVHKAAKWLSESANVDHIDLNFGCPVKKVTSAGGGSAIPLHPRLLARLVSAAVDGANGVPVTVKMRIGVSEELHTFTEAGRVSEAEGAAGVTLHARTAEQLYSPSAQWSAIAQLSSELSIPVIGNGDIFEAGDAVRMMRETGCAGVMVGRACLGRPWLVGQIRDAMTGKEPCPEPRLQEAVGAAKDHLERLVTYWDDETTAVKQMRKFVSLYMMGYESAGALRGRLLSANTVADWSAAVAEAEFDALEQPCAASLRQARLKGGTGQRLKRVALPHGWLEDRESDQPPTSEAAEAAVEG